TLDRTGRVVRERAVAVTREQMLATLAARTGEHDQLPPMYSAIKQGGIRLYERARAGEDVERQPRRVRIDQLELLAFEPPRFRSSANLDRVRQLPQSARRPWHTSCRRGHRRLGADMPESISPVRKAETIAKFAQHQGDTGSPEVQIALMSERITHLTEHLKT